MQKFKPNEEAEQKVIDAAAAVIDPLSMERDLFFEQANEAYPLGDILYSLDRDPMAGVILPESFRASFPAIHELFTSPGTFDFYLAVIRSIWGEDVTVEFVIPDPGKLTINVAALDIELATFLSRYIEGDVYFYDEMITQPASDTIIFQTTQGIKTQREANALVFELAPAGVYTVMNLEVT